MCKDTNLALGIAKAVREEKRKHMDVIERYIGAKVVAQHLGVAKSFIYKMISERRIPYYKIGCRYLFKLSEIERVIATEMKYA